MYNNLSSVSRFPEVVEHTCSITSLMLGETLPSITKDMDTYTYRLPLGVCAGIAPFNFPAMIPLWMFPMGMVCGNTYLMKPSERVPGCTVMLAKLLQDAGAPDGTLNIIHGQHDGMIFTGAMACFFYGCFDIKTIFYITAQYRP